MLNSADKPLVLQIGSHVLYAEAHVPGSEYVGAAGTSAGLQALRERVAGLGKGQTIVIYCGCCPWGKCPNIRPAYELLQSLGFSNVKALYIPDNFGTDWVNKGYPVAKGR
jgi:thiosulfate/3-mercaptopyruvate sulfurtransferase